MLSEQSLQARAYLWIPLKHHCISHLFKISSKICRSEFSLESNETSINLFVTFGWFEHKWFYCPYKNIFRRRQFLNHRSKQNSVIEWTAVPTITSVIPKRGSGGLLGKSELQMTVGWILPLCLPCTACEPTILMPNRLLECKCSRFLSNI